MSITILNQVENYRGISFSFVGDATSTAFPVTHNRHTVPSGRTSTAFVVTGPTAFERRSERGGLIAPVDGTVLTVNSVLESAVGVVTITLSTVVASTVTAYGTIVFGPDTN
jgi:hypothetical protein